MVLLRKIQFNDINIDKQVDIHQNQLSLRVKRWAYDGAGWNTTSTFFFRDHFL